jgi:hypothetical protein
MALSFRRLLLPILTGLFVHTAAADEATEATPPSSARQVLEQALTPAQPPIRLEPETGEAGRYRGFVAPMQTPMPPDNSAAPAAPRQWDRALPSSLSACSIAAMICQPL